jgi:hypothetical protein
MSEDDFKAEQQKEKLNARDSQPAKTTIGHQR